MNSDDLNLTSSTTYSYGDTFTVTPATYSNTVIGGGYAVPNIPNVTIGSPSITGTSYPYTIGAGISSPTWSNSISPKIKLDGEGADIEVNGRSLMDMLDRIERRLEILVTNPKLEVEWAELKELGEKYRALEQHIKEKQATWDRLKAMPPPEID